MTSNPFAAPRPGAPAQRYGAVTGPVAPRGGWGLRLLLVVLGLLLLVPGIGLLGVTAFLLLLAMVFSQGQDAVDWWGIVLGLGAVGVPGLVLAGAGVAVVCGAFARR